MRLFFALFVLGTFACGEPPPVDECADTPTYTNDIRPRIIEAKCLGCHSMMLTGSARNGAPIGIDFDTYELTQPHLESFASAITSGREPPPTLMPPIEVTAEERDLVRDWRACQFPK